MKNVFLLLLQSRKAIVALTAILGASFVAIAGFVAKAAPEAILGLLGAITGLSWKLMETIASEDISKRAQGEVYFVETGEEPAPQAPVNKNTN